MNLAGIGEKLSLPNSVATLAGEGLTKKTLNQADQRPGRPGRDSNQIFPEYKPILDTIFCI